MKFPQFEGRHLTYCTNVHAGESWPEMFEALREHVPALRDRLGVQGPFGVGMRLSARAAGELLAGDALERFRAWLEEQQLYVFTMNGFPYGNFHRKPVKEQVYEPDWTTTERLEYTGNLVDVMAALVPPGMQGSISTSPVAWKYRPGDAGRAEELFEKSAVAMAKLALKMDGIRRESGRELHLNIEPEPDCLLETSRETVDFFRDYLLGVGSSHVQRAAGLSEEQARELLLFHIRVCYDTCHVALEYEQVDEVLTRFEAVGIRVGKVQVSSALRLTLPATGPQREEALQELSRFDEPVYLHQVLVRDATGAIRQYRDLPEALRAAVRNGDSTGGSVGGPESGADESATAEAESALAQAEEWRVHFHVPLFADRAGVLQTTSDEAAQSLRTLLDRGDCGHFEIETYTWEVLPEELKTSLTDSIAREYEWVLRTVRGEKS